VSNRNEGASSAPSNAQSSSRAKGRPSRKRPKGIMVSKMREKNVLEAFKGAEGRRETKGGRLTGMRRAIIKEREGVF